MTAEYFFAILKSTLTKAELSFGFYGIAVGAEAPPQPSINVRFLLRKHRSSAC